MSARDDSTQPDFGALYAGSDRQGWVTPRLAYSLWSAAGYLADTWTEDLDEPELLLRQLPPTVRAGADRAWLERFIRCFEDIANRIATGMEVEEGLAECTGDEMALHLIVHLAEATHRDGMLEEDDSFGRLPGPALLDEHFEDALEYLFQDHDVLRLFDMSLDGMDDPDSSIAHLTRFANLRPRDWFLPFS